jgi:hypothetical protein
MSLGVYAGSIGNRGASVKGHDCRGFAQEWKERSQKADWLEHVSKTVLPGSTEDISMVFLKHAEGIEQAEVSLCDGLGLL